MQLRLQAATDLQRWLFESAALPPEAAPRSALARALPLAAWAQATRVLLSRGSSADVSLVRRWLLLLAEAVRQPGVGLGPRKGCAGALSLLLRAALASAASGAAAVLPPPHVMMPLHGGPGEARGGSGGGISSMVRVGAGGLLLASQVPRGRRAGAAGSALMVEDESSSSSGDEDERAGGAAAAQTHGCGPPPLPLLIQGELPSVTAAALLRTLPLRALCRRSSSRVDASPQLLPHVLDFAGSAALAAANTMAAIAAALLAPGPRDGGPHPWVCDALAAAVDSSGARAAAALDSGSRGADSPAAASLLLPSWSLPAAAGGGGGAGEPPSSVHAAFLPLPLAHSGGGAAGDPPLASGVTGALLDHHAALDAATALAEAVAVACVRWAEDAEEEAPVGLLCGPVAAHLVSASAACALLLSRADLRQAAAEALPVSPSAGPSVWLARCLRILARLGCRFSPRAVAQRPLTPPLQPPTAAAAADVTDAACLPPAMHALLLAALATLLEDGEGRGAGGATTEGALQQRGPKRARLGDGRGDSGEAGEGPGASPSLVSAVLLYVGALVTSDDGGAGSAAASPPIIVLPGGESIGPPSLAGGLCLRSLPLARAPHADPLPAALSKASVALWPIAPPAKLAALAPAAAALERLMRACWATCDPAAAGAAAADPPTALFCATLHRISAGLAARADQLQAILMPRGSPPSLLACLRSYAGGGPGVPFAVFTRPAAGGDAAVGEPVVLDDAEPDLIAACAAAPAGRDEN